MPPKEVETGRTKTTAAPKSPKEQSGYSEPIRVLLLSDEETPTASLVEKRLQTVRRLYALGFILRVPEVAGTEVVPIAALLLSTDENADLDPLVPIALHIRAAGTGTFWVDFFLRIPSHLPAAADLKQWAEWLKNAHSALTDIAAICGIVGTWLKRYAGRKAPAVQRQVETSSPIGQLLKRIDGLKGATEDDKEEIRRAIIRDLYTFDPTPVKPMALEKSIDIPKNFPLKLGKKSTAKKKK